MDGHGLTPADVFLLTDDQRQHIVKKLTLNMDELEVVSFETYAAEGEAGTVEAHITGTRCKDTVEDYTCGIWCPPTTDPQNTGPCAC